MVGGRVWGNGGKAQYGRQGKEREREREKGGKMAEGRERNGEATKLHFNSEGCERGLCG